MMGIDTLFLYLVLCCCILVIVFLLAIVFLFVSYGSEFIELISTIAFIRRILEQLFPNGIKFNGKKQNNKLSSKNTTNSEPRRVEDAEFREIKK